MLEALKFVKGAVSTKDYVPALTHFRIQGGRVSGYNGKMSLSSPIALDLDCCPKAIPFVKAIEACEGQVQLALLQNGKLAVRSGAFKAHIETLADEYPDIGPEGVPVAIDGQLLPALATLFPFTSDDASRPWAAGILLDGGSAIATNNVVLCEVWLGYHFPYRVNLPRTAVRELLRIGEEPIAMQLSGGSATFYFTGDRWLRTQLNDVQWPDTAPLFANVPLARAPVPDGLFEALAQLAPFTDEHGRVHLREGRIATVADDSDEGASVQLPGAPGKGVFNLAHLASLQGVADAIDFSNYPLPCSFTGDRLRGLIIGMRG